MVRRCCVMGCDGNYNEKKKKKKEAVIAERKQKVFRLPRNEEEKEQWIRVIPRDNIPISKHTV